MYTEENYFWGLVAYGLGVLLVLPAMLKVTGFVMPWKPVRVVLRLFFVALLLTPVYAYQDVKFIAPAWIVAVFETIRSTSPEGAAPAYAALTSAFVGLCLVAGFYYLGRHLWRRRTAASADRPDPGVGKARGA